LSSTKSPLQLIRGTELIIAVAIVENVMTTHNHSSGSYPIAEGDAAANTADSMPMSETAYSFPALTIERCHEQCYGDTEALAYGGVLVHAELVLTRPAIANIGAYILQSARGSRTIVPEAQSCGTGRWPPAAEVEGRSSLLSRPSHATLTSFPRLPNLRGAAPLTALGIIYR
jgi:hypothetical protein